MKYKVTYCNDTTKILDTNSIKDADDFFTVAYTKNGINQIIAVRASSEQEAKQKFIDYMKKKGRQVEFAGVTRGKEDKPGLPVIDTCVKDSRKLFTIMVNDKIYKVKAKDEACAMKAIKDYGEKDALVDMLNGAIRFIKEDNYAQAAKILGHAIASVNNLSKVKDSSIRDVNFGGVDISELRKSNDPVLRDLLRQYDETARMLETRGIDSTIRLKAEIKYGDIKSKLTARVKELKNKGIF